MKYYLLGIVTLGIYQIVVLHKISKEINAIVSRYDGKNMMSYGVLFGLSCIPIFGGAMFVYQYVWWHKFCNRIGEELKRRRIAISFGASDYWLWNVLGKLILGGSYLFIYKLFEAANALAADFNVKG